MHQWWLLCSPTRSHELPQLELSGLGNPRTIRELHHLIKTKSPHFVFLIETKCNRSMVEKVRNQLGFEHRFIVDGRAMSEGLAFMWKSQISVCLDSFTQSHFFQSFTFKDQEKWFLTGFYRSPLTIKRKDNWRLLRALRPKAEVAWLCVGDFNEILQHDEKYRAVVRPYSQLEGFRDAIEDCGQTDLGFLGAKYTWGNHRESRSFTKKRLDRAFRNSAWHILNELTFVRSLAAQSSDHYPLLITMEKKWMEQ